jgi:pimeloyl-ACP methyl ester carboxylesterase
VHEVGAAIAYARAHGATGVVLYAWSMGGAVSMTASRRLPPADATFIKGLVLDSANIDWTAILEYQGSQNHLPGFVTWTAERFAEWRADLSLADFDQRRTRRNSPCRRWSTSTART